MKKIALLLAVFLLAFNGAWPEREPNCANCTRAGDLLEKVESTREAYLQKEEQHKKLHVEAGPTDELKNYELAQGQVFRFVCNNDNNSQRADETRAMINLVLDLNKMNIESDTMHEVLGCFRARAIRYRQNYNRLAKQMGREGELYQLIVADFPSQQDDEVKRK